MAKLCSGPKRGVLQPLPSPTEPQRLGLSPYPGAACRGRPALRVGSGGLTRPSLQQPLTFYWCRSPAFSRTPWSWSHTMHRACRVGHLFRQASLTWQFAFKFLPCLFIPRWFMSFFVLNNIPLSGGARGYLSIHQLENILLPSNFRQLRIKLRYAPV